MVESFLKKKIPVELDLSELIHYLYMASSRYWLAKLMSHLCRSNECFKVVISVSVCMLEHLELFVQMLFFCPLKL